MWKKDSFYEIFILLKKVLPHHNFIFIHTTVFLLTLPPSATIGKKRDDFYFIIFSVKVSFVSPVSNMEIIFF